jgi:hypothetical protein
MEGSEPAMAPSDVDPSVPALDAANAALAAAKAARPRIVVKDMPTLDDQLVDIKKRPLLSSYVLGDMFDMAFGTPDHPGSGPRRGGDLQRPPRKAPRSDTNEDDRVTIG